MRVLIVDDEAPIRRLLQSWVQADGHEAVEAASAEQALAVVETEGLPAVAVCDLRLPGQDGLWLAEQFRENYPEIAVVMATAVHEFDVAVNSLQARVVDYLAKPYTRERFTAALKQAGLVHQARLANRQMQRELDERRRQITEAFAELEMNANSALDAMLAMLHARDSVSFDHAHRVAKLALDVAMAMQIGEPHLSDIERAALLHNLGRLALPDDLLSRDRATLNAADRARLYSYPLHGYAMLKNVPILARANQIAVAAHERSDGSGFPHGLRLNEIPLGARIIAVADAYDELTFGVGAAAISPSRAIELLTTTRAQEFDPEVLLALKTLQPGIRPTLP
jgi:response regulator RpfG family c-di-GMP phosphodiesterase